jgi:hypothetical protein
LRLLHRPADFIALVRRKVELVWQIVACESSRAERPQLNLIQSTLLRWRQDGRQPRFRRGSRLVHRGGNVLCRFVPHRPQCAVQFVVHRDHRLVLSSGEPQIVVNDRIADQKNVRLGHRCNRQLPMRVLLGRGHLHCQEKENRDKHGF